MTSIARIVVILCAIGVSQAAPAGLITHSYQLNGDLTDQLGGPSLVSNGTGYLDSDGTYRVTGHGSGLSLSNSLNTANYAIEMVFSLDIIGAPEQCQSGPYKCSQKLIDFGDRNLDYGIYIKDAPYDGMGQLQFFGGATGVNSNDLVTLGEFAHLVISRDDATKDLRGYINGTLFFNTTDPSGFATFTGPNNVAHFMMDDFAYIDDAPVGSIDSIALYDGPLSSTEIEQLYAARSVPEPASILLMMAGVAGVGCYRKRMNCQ